MGGKQHGKREVENDGREGSTTIERIPEIKVKTTQLMQQVGIAQLSMNGSGVNLIFDDGGRFTLSVVMVKQLLSGNVETAGISFCDKWNPKTAVPKVRETTQNDEA